MPARFKEFKQSPSGDGELGRTLRDLQRKYFRPPTAEQVSMDRHTGGG
jgi:hypothetical protein